MPDDEHVEATAKRLAEEVTRPAIDTFKRRGHSVDETEAYGSLLAAKAEMTFRTKWKELDRLRCVLSGSTTH